MKIINGRKISNKILFDLEKEIKEKKTKPCLAIILIGNDPASQIYVRLKEKTAQKIGIKIKKYFLSDQTLEKEILDIIKSLNKDNQVNGILVQFPLPKHISSEKIIQAINPEKDVDGFLSVSKFDPPFIMAIWQAIKETKEDLKDKKTIALVNSDIFGRALVSFFKKKRVKVEYVILRAKPEESLTDSSLALRMTKDADILITAIGHSHFINGSMIKKGAILIDGGISKKNGKIVGDIDIESVKEKAKWITSTPGGLGPITIALLLKNVVLVSK